MKQGIKGFIKKNIKGFVVGFLFVLVAGAVSAEIIFNSATIAYTPPINNLGSVNTVQKALDALYRIKPPVYYYAFGDPTLSSPTDYSSMTHRVFVRVSVDYINVSGNTNKEVCIVRNGELGCFKNGTANWASNKYLLQAFFSDITCNLGSSIVGCDDDSSHCDVDSNGFVSCYDLDEDERCNVDASGTVDCG